MGTRTWNSHHDPLLMRHGPKYLAKFPIAMNMTTFPFIWFLISLPIGGNNRGWFRADAQKDIRRTQDIMTWPRWNWIELLIYDEKGSPNLFPSGTPTFFRHFLPTCGSSSAAASSPTCASYNNIIIVISRFVSAVPIKSWNVFRQFY